MTKARYKEQNFQAKTLKIIDLANEIVESYTARNLLITIRQLYYQFVSRNAIANKMSEYKRLSGILSDARYAGLLDWDAIVDRTRPLHRNSHWGGPADILRSAANSYAIDKWAGQKYRPEVWIEKEALIGVIEETCENWDLSYFACKGYGSSSVMKEAADRLHAYADAGQRPIILHLGDHDPSGEDMTRDIIDRFCIFGVNVEVRRLALNMRQVQEYGLPPQPAKKSDARSKGYIERHGSQSWELDALGTDVLIGLIDDAVNGLVDMRRWNAAIEREEADRQRLLDFSRRWPAN